MKKKGKYVFLGLSSSGKATLIRQLVEDNEIDFVPYSLECPNIEPHSQNTYGKCLVDFTNIFGMYV